MIENILLKAYVDAVVEALNEKIHIEYASASIGEEITDDDDVEYHNVVAEVRFYWSTTKVRPTVSSTVMVWVGHGKVGVTAGAWRSNGALSREAAVDAVRAVVENANAH